MRVHLRRRVIGRRLSLLSLRKLLKERRRPIIFKAQSRLAFSRGRDLLTSLFPLEVALKCIKEKSVVGHTVPVENLLLLLGSDTVVLVEKVEKRALWLFQRRIGASFEVAQI